MTHGSSISFGTSYIRIARERKERKKERKKENKKIIIGHHFFCLLNFELPFVCQIRDSMIRDGNEGNR